MARPTIHTTRQHLFEDKKLNFKGGFSMIKYNFIPSSDSKTEYPSVPARLSQSLLHTNCVPEDGTLDNSKRILLIFLFICVLQIRSPLKSLSAQTIKSFKQKRFHIQLSGESHNLRIMLTLLLTEYQVIIMDKHLRKENIMSDI